ncbi:response regulator [Aneurinibacillus tyrosinisolvens]|uniref:response regulator n=1 Tax=Aneurinibacillus tyrosinisolvens TaxID=1443435 RepID=UPI00069974DC|nr:response regulator transcription factor [Aneurinibacillus tyrosinisolvens]
MKKIKVVIVEDQELVREGLHILLNTEPDIEVIGTAGDGRAGVTMCQKLKPDIVLMDIHMPGMDGVVATGHIKKLYPEIKVIILTTYQEISYVIEALSVGAEGYLLKAIQPKDLSAGIRLIHHGGTLIPPEMARGIVAELKELKTLVKAPKEQRLYIHDLFQAGST